MQAGGHNGIKAADAMVDFHFECEVQYGMDVRLWFGCGGGRIYIYIYLRESRVA